MTADGWPALTASSAEVNAVIRELFATSTSPGCSIAIDAGDAAALERREDVRWSIDGAAQPPLDLARVLHSSLQELTRRALDHDTDRLHLHAGLIEDRGRGIVIVGSSGSGKTTMTASLLARGCFYGTDESVAVDERGLVEGLARPLALKPGALAQFEHVRALRHRAFATWPLDQVHLGIAPSTIDDGSAAATTIVLLDRRDTNVSTSLTPITPATAVRQLVDHSLDFDRFGPDLALAALAALVGNADVVELCYHDALEGADHLLNRVRRAKIATRPPTTPEVISKSSGSCGVTVGPDAVVWCDRPSRVVEIGSAAFAAWASADGTTTQDERAQVLGAPIEALRRIDRELVAAGLLDS